MISGTGSHTPHDVLLRQDAAIQNASPVPNKETTLPPAETVQQSGASAKTNNSGTDASSPFISLSTGLITALQGEEDQGVPESTEEKVPGTPLKEGKGQAEASSTGLSDAEEAQVDTLSARDREVRSHENAHATAGGQYAGSPSYEYETGPNGQQYAVGGEVQIDTATIPGDPSATIAKMETIVKAALAPADPSGQDKAVAAAATQKKMEAQAALNAMKLAERTGEAPESNDAPSEQSPAAPASDGSFVDPASRGSPESVINIIT